MAELDSPWNGYVEGVERLVNAVKQHNNEAGVNADAVIRGLDTRISEAIMHTMGKGKEIENRVSVAGDMGEGLMRRGDINVGGVFLERAFN